MKKVESPGSKKGFSTLEMLIAMSIIVLAISSVAPLVFGEQTVSIDSQTNQEALYKAQALLESARATSRSDFGSVATSAITTDGIYQTQIVVDPNSVTQCARNVTANANWTNGRMPLNVSLTTRIGDSATAAALGGDCDTAPPNSLWNNPQPFASQNLGTGNPTALDVLNGIAYLGTDQAPYLFIADAGGTVFSSFNPGAPINSIDAVHETASGKTYLFLAMHSATSQLKVVDVTDIDRPFLAAARVLSPCVAGSAPQGWRVRYYDGKLYLTTRFTAGPELHIFDVADPANPAELNIGGSACRGFEFGNTVNDFVIKDVIIAGATKRFGYFATDESDKELRVFDLTNPFAIREVLTANQNLPGIQNGLSVFAVGNTLYFGRQSAPSGPDLYVYDTANPLSELPLLGAQDIGTGVFGIKVSGRFAFLATPKANKEFQIWNISDVSNISFVQHYHLDNMVEQGLDYESGFVYGAGTIAPNFQILYSP